MGVAEALISYGLFSTLAMALVQFLKYKFSETNVVVILAVISVFCGSVYAVLMGTGMWEIVYKHMIIIGSAANAIYTVLDQILKNTSGETLSRG